MSSASNDTRQFFIYALFVLCAFGLVVGLESLSESNQKPIYDTNLSENPQAGQIYTLDNYTFVFVSGSYSGDFIPVTIGANVNETTQHLYSAIQSNTRYYVF